LIGFASVARASGAACWGVWMGCASEGGFVRVSNKAMLWAAMIHFPKSVFDVCKKRQKQVVKRLD
jgi:hypothetical protein